MLNNIFDDKSGVYRIKFIYFNNIGRLSGVDNSQISLSSTPGDEFVLNRWDKKTIVRYKLPGTNKIEFMYEFNKSKKLAEKVGISNGDFTKISEKSDMLAPFQIGLIDSNDPKVTTNRVWRDISVTAEETEFKNGQWIMVKWTVYIQGFGELI